MEPARILSSSKPHRPHSRSLILAVLAALLSLGCAAKAGPGTPAWPEEPSPSYPDPNAKPDANAGAEARGTPKSTEVPESAPGSLLAKEYDGKESLETLNGKASYYADSLAGNHTANGDVYDPKHFTAAHRKLPFGTIVRVIREDTGAVTYAKVNDRGPFGSHERIIDLSKAAAMELEMMKAGVVDVRVEVVDRPKK